MANSIGGKGRFYLVTDSGVLLPRAYASFRAVSEKTIDIFDGFRLFELGSLETYDTQTLSESWTLTVTQSYFTRADVAELMYNVYDKKSTTEQSIPSYKKDTITSDTVTLTGAASDAMLAITLIESNKHTPMKKVDGPIAAADEYTVATDTITFQSGTHEGKTVAIVYSGTIAVGSDVIGGANGNGDIVSMQIHGGYKIGSEVFSLWFPSIKPAGGANAPIGSTDELEKEYTATVPTELGWSKPYLDVKVA